MIYSVVDSNGKVVEDGFESRQEAKKHRGENQFVIRNEHHPLGRSRFSAMKQKMKDVIRKDVVGENITLTIRTQ